MFGDLQENIQRAMEKMGQTIKTETTREITREITREMTSLMNARTLGLKGVKWFEGEDGDRKTIKERV